MKHSEEELVKRKRILPPTYLFVSILVIVVLHFQCPMLKVIPFPWNLMGVIPVVLGLALNLAADRAFKKHNTTVKPFTESTVLITNGVFSFTRNPMYLGFVLILIGISILLGSLIPYLIVVIFAISMDVVFIGAEERMLQGAFGESWLQYTKSVRRWL
jgi:protein-S-isoprenylcysteine O-methyltransferase Ste14